MPEVLFFNSDEQCIGMRIDVFVSNNIKDMTRSGAQKLFDAGMITVNGKISSKNYKLRAYDKVCVSMPEPKVLDITAENIPLDIRYEDNDLLVVNKPKGMVVHPAAGNYSSTLVNALMYHCGDSLSGINGVIRPGIVHRIDKDTSGLLIVAKNDRSHLELARQIKDHSFTREYRCVAYGHFKEAEGTVDAPIGRHPLDRKKMAVTEKNSRNAVTHYYTLKEYKDFTYLRLRLETGRTHQIRVHLAYIGHPIAGDGVYGPKKCITELKGQCLHAGLIGFVHPTTKKYIELSSELPEYFEKFLGSLKE